MSRRQSVPSNIFYRKADPNPPLFPGPHEGDIYFNTTTGRLRIFHEEEWRDASFSVSVGDIEEVWSGTEEPTDPATDIWIRHRWKYSDVYYHEYDLSSEFTPSLLVRGVER